MLEYIPDALVMLSIVYSRQFFNVNRPMFIMSDIHNDVAKGAELCSTNRLCEEVYNHFVSGTVFKREMFERKNISYEEISDVHEA